MHKKVFVTIIVFLLVAVVLFIKLAPHTARVAHVVSQYVFHREELLKQTNGHTNILLLGIGGGIHDGPNLTDTIIFASIAWKQDKIALISIPRDLWNPDSQAKVNTVYAFGEEKKKGEGLPDTERFIAKLTGQPVHYGFRIDFSGFVKAVDEVGGLDVTVDRAFDDYQYPIEGKENDTCGHTDTQVASLSAQIASSSASELDTFPCRYMHLHFDTGSQQMDGITALEYVRSRHALGPEGSDFARSKRQSKVITAFKEKIFSAQTFLNPARIITLTNILKDSIDTDIPNTDVALFLDQIQKLKAAQIHSGVLDIGDDIAGRKGLLVNPPISAEYNNTWVLAPRIGNGDFSEIQQYIACEINNVSCLVTESGIKVGTSSAK